MQGNFGTVFDCEGDGLVPTKLHVLSATYDGERVSSTPEYSVMQDFLLSEEVLVGHNIARWDIPVLERILGIDLKEKLLVDTLALSWYLTPDRARHGLESYGEEFGVPKPKIEDWDNLTYEDYRHRCEEDVKISHRLWRDQYWHLLEIYGDHDLVVQFLRYLAFKMDCAKEQERSRWRLDRGRVDSGLEKLRPLVKEREDELRHVMPKVPNVVTFKRPARMYKSDGQLSAHGLRWIERLRAAGNTGEDVETVDVIESYDDPNPGSTPQIKKWLFDLGWKPRTFKTNKKGQEVPQINKSKQDGGGVCDSVKELYEIEPRLEVLDGLFVVRHRISILEGFLESVSDDGFVSARIQGLTNTLRFKHAEVVNLPKVDAPYGEDIRGCLIASDDDHELCGSDMSSLEDRTKQHFMFQYDPDYVHEMNTEDFDPHLDLAVIGGLMKKADSLFYKSFQPSIAGKDEHTRYKLLKTIRGIAKNTNYACVYGAGAPKIAKTAGISVQKAGTLHSAYWKRNWAVKKVANSLKVKEVRGAKWIFNPVSKFWYSLRHDKDRFSTLNQGTGVFAFDTWLGFVRADRPQLTAQFHDEIILNVRKGYREEVKEFLQETIRKVNEQLRLNRDLDIGIEFGEDYAAVH